MQTIASEILLSSYPVGLSSKNDIYEFILNEQLQVVECLTLKAIAQNIIQPIRPTFEVVENMLFELKQVRVNPNLDNSYIIALLTNALSEIGIRIYNQPSYNSMAICYKPLGEISHTVRFYINPEGNLIFLSPTMRPKLVYSKPNL